MSDRGRSNWIADAALLTSALMWGINIPIVKFATTNVDPLVFNASRVIFSTLALGLLAWIEIRSRSKEVSKIDWGRVLIYTLLSGLVYALLFMFGIKRTTAANAALLMATMPMWTAFLSRFLLAERLRSITWIGLAITIAGTLIVISAKGQLDFSAGRMAGNLLILSAAFTWALATVVSRPLMETVGPLRLSFISCALTTPIHWIIVGLNCNVDWSQLIEPTTFLCILYSGVLSTGVAYATWNFGVQRLGGSHASVYQNVVTLVAVFGGWIALHEAPLVAQILGGILMIIGLLTMRRGRN